MANPEITFWPHSTRLSVASFRIRCAQVRAGLRDLGIETSLRDERAADFARPPDVLILSKRTDSVSLQTAIRLRRERGTRLILDLCDNVYYGYAAAVPVDRLRFDALTEALNQLDLIVTPSDYLRDAVSAHVRSDMPFATIPDAVESPPATNLLTRLRHLPAFARMERLRHRVEGARIAEGRRLIWFGIGGTRKARNGLYDLASFCDALERHDRARPISLTILSDSRRKYREVLANRRFRTWYTPWNYWTFDKAFAFHDIAILPVRRNDYNWAKSANRLTTAFANRVAVCATAVPSYEPFRRAAVLDDWDEGLAHLMDSAADRAHRIEIGRSLIEQDYTCAAVSRRWAEALSSLADLRPNHQDSGRFVAPQRTGQVREPGLKV